jgi:hypothetical protein
MDADQRAILLHMRVDDVLLDDGGWTRLMQSMRGGMGPRRPGGGRQIHSYECRNQKITAEWFDGTKTVVTKGDVAKYLKTVEPQLIDTLRGARDAERAENRRTSTWCWCQKYLGTGVTNDHSRPFPPLSYHPTNAESDEHYRIVHACTDERRAALAAVLQLAEPVKKTFKPEPTSEALAGMLFTVTPVGMLF